MTTPESLEALALRLRSGAEALRSRPVAEIVAALGAVADRWADASDRSSFRAEAEERLAAATGYAPLTLRTALDRLFAELSAGALRDLLRAELGDPEVLDGFRSRGEAAGASPLLQAIGPGLTVIWASGNIPVAAVPALFHALLTKSPCLVKTAAAEPILLPLVVRTIAETAPWLGEVIAADHWPGQEEALGRSALRHADAVIAFGSAPALAAVRSWAPVPTRFRGCGPRIGFGVVGREQMTAAGIEAIAERAAWDVALFDQQGCVSPHLIYVETGGEQDARALAGRIGAALARRETEAPRRPLDAAEAAAIHQLRAAHEMRALATPDAALVASTGGTAWTVLVDPDPTFAPGPLNRTLFVKPIADIAQVAALVAPLAGYLQTVVVALEPTRRAELAERLARVGITRVAPLGRAQEPSLVAPHDGYPRVADLVRWVAMEA